MRMLMPLFAASFALLAEATEIAQGPDATAAGAEVAFLDNDAPWKWERRRSPIVAVAFLAAAVALMFLVLQCFKTLHSDDQSNGYGVNRRRLADGGSDPCTVGVGAQTLSTHATQRYRSKKSLEALLVIVCLRVGEWSRRCKGTQELSEYRRNPPPTRSIHAKGLRGLDEAG
ncbi:hypothetical protein, conserved [Eimeria praecox]|uniref:Uncharacterized protein n=1 Tax=Eimeria praecox TaxID=51316 RepID=U6GTN6_9EIME|nr:hypothetical protein, conserved [Eimeria praecox]